MSKTRVVLCVLAAATLSCHQVILTAPPGSTMSVTANPTSIPAYGGVSIISALVIEPAGTPVSDGTVVQFFTDLGVVEEQGKTNDGVARVKLTSDSRSGTATVTALSGGGVSTTGTPADTTEAVASALATSASGASGQVQVTIGSVLIESVYVTANPGRIVPPATQSEIVATAYDASGNPVPRVPIMFTAFENDTAKAAYFETLQSNGVPVYTDNNGRAHDLLTTTYDPNANRRYVKVVATPPVGESNLVFVQIN
jgi:hypothetical protein